jgi:hypothetical protein
VAPRWLGELARMSYVYAAKRGGRRAFIHTMSANERSERVLEGEFVGAPAKFVRIRRKRLNILQTSDLQLPTTIIERHPSKGCQ